MKLTSKYFANSILFEENTVNVLVVENKNEYSKLIMSLYNFIYNQGEDFILSEETDFLNPSGFLNLVISPMDICTDKKFVNKIYKMLELKLLENSTEESFVFLKKQICDFVDDIIFDFEIALTHDVDYTLSTLLKVVDLKPEIKQDSIYDSVYTFLTIVSAISEGTVVIFVNLKTYLDDNQISDLYRFANYKKIHLLLVESLITKKLENEKILVIDEDLCELIL